MTGLQRLTNYPLAVIRGGIEIGVVIVGVLLGGMAGIGTLLFAFGIGPALAVSILLLSQLFDEANAS
jgi:uncharacterized membrane protein YczE